MNYEKMWNELRDKVARELDYYKNGAGCSWAEAVHGANHCNWFLEVMNELENRKG